MFTGIIEEIGTIKHLNRNNDAIVMSIQANNILEDVNLGDSIAVNGVCLTVTSFTNSIFTVDIMPETVKATSLRNLSIGSKVNLERAMSANGRFGGHFVSGHVDGIGEIVSKESKDNAVYYKIKTSSELLKYIVYKGSITVDGTSLTVFGVDHESFTISIIPHTIEKTIIGSKNNGDIVNLECDMIGKYIEQFLAKRFDNKKAQGNITEAFLKEHGYL